jgi:hypothetical protein
MIDVSSHDYQFTGLSLDTDYEIIVVAENDAGYSVKQIIQNITDITPVLNSLVISSYDSSSITLQQPTLSIAGNPTPTVQAYIGVTGTISVSGPTVSGAIQGPVDVSSGDYQFTGLNSNANYEVIVVAENGQGYSVKQIIQSTLSNIATVTSTTYTVSAGGTANETITGVPDRTSKTTFEAELVKVNSNETWNDAGIHDPVLTGDTLIVTSQDLSTVVTYTATVFVYSVGEMGPGEGWIFYINPNYVTDGWKYLETESGDVGEIQWYNGSYDVTTGATGVNIGTGLANTNAIISTQGIGFYAAWLCGGNSNYNDWFLPSIDELILIYENLALNGIGGFTPNIYWSSSEYDKDHAWYLYFWGGGAGTPGVYPKSSTCYIRCVREF